MTRFGVRRRTKLLMGLWIFDCLRTCDQVSDMVSRVYKCGFL